MRTRNAQARRGWLYLALAVGWTWGFWLAAAVLGRPMGDTLTMALLVAGAAGVPGLALVFLHVAGDRAARHDYWRRLFDPCRPGWRGWLLVLLPPAVALVAAGLNMLAGGSAPDPERLRTLATAPATVLPTLLFVLAFGPLPEEMGWRGYALDLLQAAHGPLAAALLLGVVHALWHLPLFFIEGSFQHGLGAFTPAFWRYMASIVALSVVLSWAFNLGGRSTLLAVLIHFAENLGGELLGLPEPAERYRLGLYLAIAAGITIATRGRLAKTGKRTTRP